MNWPLGSEHDNIQSSSVIFSCILTSSSLHDRSVPSAREGANERDEEGEWDREEDDRRSGIPGGCSGISTRQVMSVNDTGAKDNGRGDWPTWLRSAASEWSEEAEPRDALNKKSLAWL